MTSEEAQQLALIGGNNYANLTFVIFGSTLLGVYLLAFAIGMRVLLWVWTCHDDMTDWWHVWHPLLSSTKKNGKATKVLTGFLMVAFVFTMLFISGTILFELVLLKFGLIKSAPDGLAAQQLAASAKPILGIWNAIIVWSVNLSVSAVESAIV